MDLLAGTYPGETTHYLGRELASRGHAIAHCTTADIADEAPAVTATVRALQYYFNAAHGTQLERAIVDAIEAAHARRTR